MNRSWPWLALGTALLSWALSADLLGSAESFALLRSAAVREPWRLWTGHLVHFNAAHLWGDLLAFAVWALLVERHSRRLLLVILCAGTPLLSLGVLWTSPGLCVYRGLSALDCTLPVVLLVLALRDVDSSAPLVSRPLLRRALAVSATALLFAKCAWEVYAGRALLAPDLGPGVRLLPAAHLLGVALGVAFALLYRAGLGARARRLSRALQG